MPVFTVYNDPDAAGLRPGQTVYPVRYRHIRRGDEWLKLRLRPGRTNLSHAPRTRGWLGTTNDVEATALGAYTVVDVRERVDVKAR